MNLYIWASCFALALTGFFCAMVRWFHMCRPYDRYKHYFYPSRKSVTILFLLTLLQIPYLINPDSEDAWLLERCLIVIYAPTFGSIVLRSFFLGNLQQWFKKMFWVILLPCLLTSVLLFFGMKGGNELEPYTNLILLLSSIFSGIIAITLIFVFLKMMQRVRQISREEYSNEDDFPARYGFTAAIISVSIWILAVIVFSIGNQTVAAVYNNLMTATGLALLIFILHPHRIKCAIIENEMVRIIEDNRTDKPITIEEHLGKSDTDIPQNIKADIEKKIRKVVIDGRLFLNPTFSKADLVSLIGTNRTYLSYVLREKFGSFYSFINRLRIEYAAEYSKEHPTATNSEISSQSGFGSVRTYTRIRNLYDKGEL